MAETAAQREARMAKAAEGKNRGEGAAPRRRASETRTKPARMTVDMPPSLRRKLKSWTGYVATELDVIDVAGAEVVRILIEQLTATPQDPAWDPEFTPALARRVMGEVSQRVNER